MNIKQLLDLADGVFAAIKSKTQQEFWTRTSNDNESLIHAKKAFDEIILRHGVVWLINAASETGMSHLGWVGWMREARAIIGDVPSASA